MFRLRVFCCLLLLVLPFSSTQHARAANKPKDLPPTYRHWIEVEVPYIITAEERKAFLSLTSDAQRDSFIDAFWKVRNPDPNSTVNTYKEEHYRRLAYANDTFGDARYEDGWRTDRGRMYIILGAPKQRAKYYDVGNVRPMEIWFYQADTPALPSFFYLLFYKRSASEDYRLYSPTYDTPVRLCSTGETRNDPVQALSILRKGLGEEVARTAVTLLPDEHVDFQEFQPSMESEALLSLLNDLPDNPMNKERLAANRARESVTTSVFLGGENASLSFETFRDERGRMTMSYLLEMGYAEPNLIGTHKDGSNYYDMTLRTDVVASTGKLAYTQEDHLSGSVSAAQAEVARKKRFGAEARLPIAPGNYNVVATLTNNVDKSATRTHANVTVPAAKSDGLAISGLLAYAAPAGVPDLRDQLPFSGSHFRFTPRGAQNVYIRQGEKLPLVFQLWLDPKTAGSTEAEKIHLHYVFGSITASHDAASQDDEDVDAGNRDQAGNLLTGHTLDTSSLPPGFYQAVVSAKREGEQRAAYATLNLHVTAAGDLIDAWTAYGPSDPGGEAVDDLKRGLSAQAQGADAQAQAAFQRALTESQGDMRALDSLAALLKNKGMTEQLAALSEQPVLAKNAASPSTLLSITSALNKTGNPKAVVRLLETQIALQPPRVDLYNALADACQATGNSSRASEVRAMAANLAK